MRPAIRRAVPVILKVLLGVAGATLVVLVAGDNNDVFDVGEKILFFAALIVGALTMFDGLVGAWREFRGGKRGEVEARVQKVLVGLMFEISKETQVPAEYVGTSIFVPKVRWVRLPGERVPRLRRVLVRVVRFRVTAENQPSRVARTKGKGAVGQCWETARTVHRPWHTQAEKFSSPDLTIAEFDKIPADKRDNFTFEEFRGIAHKYSEVLAAPILSAAGGVVGVLSVDIAVQAQQLASVLDSPAVGFQADFAAAVVRKDLKRLYPLE